MLGYVAAMPRYVVLRHLLPPHAGRPSHWDILIEADGALRAWAVLKQPIAGATLAATPLAPHRLEYLSYEGPVSGNRGEVIRVDEGDCTDIGESGDRVVLALEGREIRGQLTLVETDDSRASPPPDGQG